jgi:hypothetical protein
MGTLSSHPLLTSPAKERARDRQAAGEGLETTRLYFISSLKERARSIRR